MADYYTNTMTDLFSNKRAITAEDIDVAKDYMMNKIPCREFEPACGTHIGCSTCPYCHFKLVVLSLFQNAKNNGEEIPPYWNQ